MHITKLLIDYTYPIFDQQIELDFDKRVNLFVGPNASGKSTLLDMLSTPALRGWQFGPGWSFQGSFQDNRASQFHVDVSDDWFTPREDGLREGPDWHVVPWIRIGAFRCNPTWSEPGPKEETLNSIFQSQYGLDVFDTSKVEVALRLLIDEAQSRPRDTSLEFMLGKWRNSATRNLTQAVEVSYRCAQQIAQDVIRGSGPKNLVTGSTNLSDGLFVEYPDVRVAMAAEVLSEDSVPIDHLSSGTQTSLLWIRFLALNMLHCYDFADDWQERPAILLIDEIENHLHPTWQRRVIPALLEHFPGLQIFATTHSPFVVAGLKAGQVHLLDRDENGVVTATTNTEDVIGWTADQILRTMMCVDEPTDQATADRLNRLRQLREKETLTPEEESELNGLRRRENADLLSKGDSPLLSENDPSLKAQRERYSDLMQGFLRSRQSDLSQDGA